MAEHGDEQQNIIVGFQDGGHVEYPVKLTIKHIRTEEGRGIVLLSTDEAVALAEDLLDHVVKVRDERRKYE